MIHRPGAPAATAARFHADGTGAVSQQRLVVLLYQRLARDLDDADTAMEQGDRPRSHQALLHAQEILSELDRALDHDAWDGATQLSELYRFLIDRLVAANIGQDRRTVAECAALVAPLVEAWTEAWTSISTAPTTAPVPVPTPAAAPPAGITADTAGPAVAVPAFERVPLDVSG